MPGSHLHAAFCLTPKFSLGQLVATPNALSSVPNDEVLRALSRHSQGDWGDVDKEDWASNDHALAQEGRLLSAYNSSQGVRFWIITEHDRSVTTVLLPEDY
jgi:hypothetical protein